MDVTGSSRRIKLLLIAVCLLLRRADAPPAGFAFPDTDVTLRAIGERLGRTCSERELNAIASDGHALLGRLRPSERAALARGYLRFTVDRPVVVLVAFPRASKPFWVADQGFRSAGLVLENPDTLWHVYQKRFAAGTVGLGVNGLDRTPAAHYVVFIRSDDSRDTDPGPPTVTLDDRAAQSWTLAIASAGVSATRDFHKPFRALPRELGGSTLLQASHDERHIAVLARGRVWKTRVVAGRHPSQVAIAFGSDPARELIWTWTTSDDVALTRLRIEAEPREGTACSDRPSAQQSEPRVVMGESTAVKVAELLNDPVIRRHRVSVDHLEPSTRYRYSLGDETRKGWGPWCTVQTAHDPGDRFQFLYLGNAQTGLEGWGRLLRAAHARHPSIDFILLAGDLVDGATNDPTGTISFCTAGVFDRVPVMPCVGNHEYLDVGPRLYRAFFELPRNGPSGIAGDLVYHFEAGDACFAILDSTLAAHDPEAARQQALWLDRTFAQTRATWKFVMLHHPIYPSHPWRDVPALRERFVPIFDKHHVDFVLQGHDHAYQRTYPMRGHERARTPADGTIYLTAVSGDKFVEGIERSYVAVARAGVSTYQTFEIDTPSKRLTYRALTEEGTVLDELLVVKAPRPGAP